MSMTRAARRIPLSSSWVTSRPKVGSIVMGRLSTQKYPRSWNALVAEDIPDPLNPVMITMSGTVTFSIDDWLEPTKREYEPAKREYEPAKREYEPAKRA